MDEKWWVVSVPRSENGPGYWRIENSAGLEQLVVAATTGNEAPVLEAIVEEANLGADLKAEEAAVDKAVDAAIETTRHRTPAQSADGFLRDALVMLAAREYEGDCNCATAVKAIGLALEAVAHKILLDDLKGANARSAGAPTGAEGGDATAAVDLG